MVLVSVDEIESVGVLIARKSHEGTIIYFLFEVQVAVFKCLQILDLRHHAHFHAFILTIFAVDDGGRGPLVRRASAIGAEALSCF